MKPIWLAAALVLSAHGVHADQYTETMKSFARDNMSWVNDPIVVDAIRAQNMRTRALSQPQIDEMDRNWRQQVGLASRPLIDPVLNNPTSDFLRRHVEGSDGIMTEVFLMDGRGLNVAASDTTSDYWQGDEEKFSETYGLGAGSIHVSDIEYDDSTQTYQGQVSITIVDPTSGEVIGAATVGLNAEMLF
ncbi:hypothetical protein [Pseudooceanicola atlanticus]|uniref:Uncharacterized protein n=1 Tax=Pseudooceanicola atlanticus TaxID=1461694 RepID=A0A0A0EDQ6_9RHOB|nr:hypothetical protein [Pseudooceanicola atlanticus]KGM48420.1 hypothetical protein ATO9_12330 [Pseudooceanicola atlanticus]